MAASLLQSSLAKPRLKALSLFRAPPEKYRKQAKAALRGFSKSAFYDGGAGSSREKSRLRASRAAARDIHASADKIFIFAFGGSASPSRILRPFFSQAPRSPELIDSLEEHVLEPLRLLSKKSLRSSHCVFISKSGSAPEIIFSMDFLSSIYRRAGLSLKGRVTALVSRPESPLAEWAAKNGGAVFFSKSELPGRLSFFNLGGQLQSRLFGLKPQGLAAASKSGVSLAAESALAFALSRMDQGEQGFFCSMEPKAAALGDWFSMAWSESLFKKKARRPPEPLRHCPLSDLRYAFLEELAAGKRYLWLLNSPGREAGGQRSAALFQARMQKALRDLLAEERCPALEFHVSAWSMPSVEALMSALFQVLYGAGSWLAADIFSQPYVDRCKQKTKI